MITVARRARHHDDRAGDPLDGLVNLFDVGVVLAVAFLLAALASLNLTGALTRDTTAPPRNTITIAPSDQVRTVPPGGQRTAGRGTQVGTVYRLDDGRLIYVVPSGRANATPSPTGPAPSAGRSTP